MDIAATAGGRSSPDAQPDEFQEGIDGTEGTQKGHRAGIVDHNRGDNKFQEAISAWRRKPAIASLETDVTHG